jgi:LPS O-antigen subunit length determinant protein (WzzB/FepE family)
MFSYRQNWLRPGLIEDSLVLSGLIDQSDFQSKKDFEEEVALMAASVSLTKVATSDKDLFANPDLATHWRISFKTSQPDAWLKALELIDQKATLAAKEDFFQEYETWSRIEATKRDFAILDAEKDLDIGLTIQRNANRNRLAFLREQNEIAMAVGVANPSIGSQNFTSSAGVLTNVETDSPFYLRGHKAISKEIELIEGRQNDIEHSEDLLEIETRLLTLRSDETVERARALFSETPLANAEEFKAAQISIEATKFKSNSRNSLFLAIALIAGALIGLFIAALNSALRRRAMSESAGA